MEKESGKLFKMKLSTFFGILFFLSFYINCNQNHSRSSTTSLIGAGQMPNMITDKKGNVQLVFGRGDSILCAESIDQGKSFSTPSVVAILPKLVATAMRGPQIAFSDDGITIIAVNQPGNIYSYKKNGSGGWDEPVRVNDVDTVAKEGLMALGGAGKNLFAVWLDLRFNKHNKIVGAKSMDGGATWSKNIIIYSSPDSSVCECCKPSVAMKGDDVYVMFRNWINGNRDLYLIRSSDGGSSFGQAQKLGNGSWALNGCPMDGGSLTINRNGNAETVWNRKGEIFACEPGAQEKKLGEGSNCTMASINDKNIYAWVEKGEVVILNSRGEKKELGKGQLPNIKAINDEEVICIWGNETQIHKAILPL